MKDPSIRRNSTRLPNYDYSQDGAYFITIVTQDRLCLFGSVVDGEMDLNDAGRMVEQVCQEMPQVIRGVEIGCFQIIPNHFHAIIWIKQSVGAEEPKPIGTLDVGATLNESPQGSGDNLDQPREAEIYKYNDLIVGADLRVCPGQPQHSVYFVKGCPYGRITFK